MLENLIEVSIGLLVGLLLGILVSLLYWRRRVRERGRHILNLKTSVKTIDTEMQDMRARAKELLNQQKKEIELLNTKLIDNDMVIVNRENTIDTLNTQLKDYETLLNEREKRADLLNTQLGQRDKNIKDLNQQITEKDVSINLLKNEKNDLKMSLNRGADARAEDYKRSMNELEKGIDVLNTKLEDYETLLNEREKRADLLNTQLGQRDKNIKDLNQQITEKDVSINLLKKRASELDEKNQDSVTRAESAEAKMGKLEKSLEKHVQEIISVKLRLHAMQDDFTHVVGIGPKLSSVLRSAGINTFDKLASTDIARIEEVLMDEKPCLLRLTDPSTWSEQARLISEGDWEALRAIKERLKESRRMKSSKVDEVNIPPVIVELEVI